VSLTLTNLRRQQLFYAQYNGNQVSQLNWQNAETFTLSPPSSSFAGGQFTLNDKIVGDPNFTTYRKTFSHLAGDQTVTLELFRPGQQNGQLALTYASFGHWATQEFSTGTSRPVDLYFTYGLETPPGLLAAKTGTGRYDGVLYAHGGNADLGQYYDIGGSSRFDVDFSSQSYSGFLAMTGVSNTGSERDFGRYDFTGPLSLYTAGTQVALTQNGAVSGELDTRFYGPDGEEIAGPFRISSPVQPGGPFIYIEGVTAAKRQ
jgi:hypothetical protein